MQKPFRYFPLVVLFLLQTVFACAPAPMLTRPEWRLQGVRIERIDLSGASIGVAVQLTNPNAVGITVQHLLYRFYLHEVEIASGEKTVPFELPGHGSVDILLPVEVRLKQARELAPLLKGPPEEIDYRLEGEATVRAMGMEKRFPLHHAGKK